MIKKLNKTSLTITTAVAAILIASYPCQEARTDQLKNVVIVGWDGTQRAHLKDLIKSKKLPNLIQLLHQGAFVDINVTTGHTVTKPGWTEILTGYNAVDLGIRSNLKYQPIPKSYTIFERFKNHFGPENIKTIFIGGKENNIGNRGPHEICINCKTRLDSHLKSYYWSRDLIKTDQTKDGKPPRWVQRAGEPYYYTKDSLDVLSIGLGQADRVGNEVLKALDMYANQRFIAFFHFEEPDEMGHQFNENSAQYDNGLKKVDQWLGSIVKKLKKLKIYDQTLLIVTSDHGFREGKHNHNDAPYTFLATNSKLSLASSGDRKDVSPTIYDAFGINFGQFQPPLDGTSLINHSNDQKHALSSDI